VIRRNLVSLMFNYISEVKYTYQDYQHLLRPKRLLLKEVQHGEGDFTMTEYDSDIDIEDNEGDI
jgi:hypothetical protein